MSLGSFESESNIANYFGGVYGGFGQMPKLSTNPLVIPVREKMSEKTGDILINIPTTRSGIVAPLQPNWTHQTLPAGTFPQTWKQLPKTSNKSLAPNIIKKTLNKVNGGAKHVTPAMLVSQRAAQFPIAQRPTAIQNFATTIAKPFKAAGDFISSITGASPTSPVAVGSIARESGGKGCRICQGTQPGIDCHQYKGHGPCIGAGCDWACIQCGAIGSSNVSCDI